MKLKNQPFRIGVYVRVSTEEQAENPEGSIKNQELRLREYVKLKNLEGRFGEVIEVFVDPGISAKDMNRPSLQRLLSKIRSKEINLVLVTELSRLTRSTKDFSILWEFMNDEGCKFLSLRDNFDSTTPAGEMIMFTLANFAQFERRQTSERIANSFLARSKRGLWNGGTLPLGYDADPDRPGHLRILESEAEIVRLVFNAFLNKGTISLAARELNERGIILPRKMRKGGGIRSAHFKIDNTHRILKNKAYIGIREYQAKDGLQETQAAWEPIIDAVQFQRVQKLLKENHSRKKPPSQSRYPYMLSGFLYCKTCGDRLCGKSAHGRAGKIAYYEHAWSTKAQSCLTKKAFSCDPNRILAYKIEPLVWTEVKKILLQPTDAKAMFDEARLKYVDKNSAQKESQKLKTKILSLQSQIEATAERIAELPKGIDAGVFYAQILKLQESKKALEDQVAKTTTSEAIRDHVISYSDFQKFSEGLLSLVENCTDPDLKAMIIRKLVERIEVTPHSVIIHYHVGETHFKCELGGEKPFPDNKMGLVEKTRPVTKPLLKYSTDFSSDAGSNTLLNGRGSRT